jgi:DNA-binding NtrC family response regulator
MKDYVGKAKGNVLVIEDQQDWMRKLVQICEKAGYAARRAKNFDKAVSLLKGNEFDAVIADFRLKDWESDNIEGLQALEAIPEGIRPAAVVVTAYPDADHVRMAFRDFKVIDVLFKSSFDANVFGKKLAAAVRETRKRRDARA